MANLALSFFYDSGVFSSNEFVYHSFSDKLKQFSMKISSLESQHRF